MFCFVYLFVDFDEENDLRKKDKNCSSGVSRSVTDRNSEKICAEFWHLWSQTAGQELGQVDNRPDGVVKLLFNV